MRRITTNLGICLLVLMYSVQYRKKLHYSCEMCYYNTKLIWSFMSEHIKFHYPRVEIDDKNKIVTYDN